MTKGRQPTAQAGFTLLELLVVLSLLGVIMTGLLQAMRGIGQTEARIDQRLSRADQMQLTQSFLQSVLGQVDATLVAGASATQPASISFEQGANSIRWNGILPARPGLGGRHHLQLSLENTNTGHHALVLRYTPWQSGPWPDMQQAAAQVILSPITALDIRSQGLPREISRLGPDWPQGWQEQWHSREELPQRISLSISDAQGPWPAIVVPVLPTLASQPAHGGFVTGGSR